MASMTSHSVTEHPGVATVLSMKTSVYPAITDLKAGSFVYGNVEVPENEGFYVKVDEQSSGSCSTSSFFASLVIGGMPA